MNKISAIIAMFLFASGACFGQVTPVGTGNILTYDVFNVSRPLFSSDYTFKQNRDPRVLKLTIEETGDRKYEYLNGRPFTVKDKSFTYTSIRGNVVEMSERFQILPKDQKVVVGMQWDFSLKSQYNNGNCGGWNVTYHATAKDGPDISINIDGKDVSVKTISIEYRGEIKHDRCTPFNRERSVVYSPELNEIVKDQWLDFQPGSKLPDNDGWKWELKSISTSQAQK